MFISELVWEPCRVSKIGPFLPPWWPWRNIRIILYLFYCIPYFAPFAAKFCPLVNVYITHWKDPPFSIGQINYKSMAIFHSYVTIYQKVDSWNTLDDGSNPFDSNWCPIRIITHYIYIYIIHLTIYVNLMRLFMRTIIKVRPLAKIWVMILSKF